MSNATNIVLALDLAAALALRVQQLLQAAAAARAENRDMTDDELQRFVEADDAARDRLQAKIDAAQGGAGGR